MKIYTKTGDQGETSMLGGKRVSKSCLEMDAIGEVDELNADLGLLISELDNEVGKKLVQVQHKLFVVGSNLAGLQTDLDNLSSTKTKLSNIQDLQKADVVDDLESKNEKSALVPGLPKLENKDVEYLENWIDEMNNDLPELTNFILPGGCNASALSYRARAVCRRAERKVIGLEKKYVLVSLPLSGGADTKCGGGLVVLPNIKQYLNRLSDLLFVLGRWLNKQKGVEEKGWKK